MCNDRDCLDWSFFSLSPTIFGKIEDCRLKLNLEKKKRLFFKENKQGKVNLNLLLDN